MVGVSRDMIVVAVLGAVVLCVSALIGKDGPMCVDE